MEITNKISVYVLKGLKMKIPKITDKELICYENKKVLIYSKTREVKQLSRIYKYLNIPVLGICHKDITEDSNKKMYGLHMYSVKEVVEMSMDHPDTIIIQYSSDVDSEEQRMKEYFENVPVIISSVPSHKLLNTYLPIIMYSDFQNMTIEDIKKEYYKKVSRAYVEKRIINLMNNQLPNPIIICNPPKTADISLNITFDYINQKDPSLVRVLLNKLNPNWEMRKINYINIFHTPTAFHKDIIGDKPLKIITAVREPISQHLSHMFQGVDLPVDEYEVRIMNKFLIEGIEKDQALRKIKELFLDNGDNVQMLFDDYISNYMGLVANDDSEIDYHLQFIQAVIKKFSEHIIDIYAYPFDKEKGYTIIKEGNIEVFIYQLEKLNTILPSLSNWIGVPLKKLKRGNVGQDKWLGESYKQTQKEIKFSKDYFDSCLDGKYIKHFYSNTDIQEFRNKWSKHIKLASKHDDSL